MKNKIILIVIILKIIFITSVWAQVLTEDEQRLEEFRKAFPSHEEALRALLSLQKAAQEQREQLNNSCEKEKLIMLQNCKTDKPTCDCQNLANQIESLEKNNNSIRNSLETNQQVVKEAETLKQQLEIVNQENQTLRIKVTDLENLKTRVNELSIQLEERQAKVAELERQNAVLTETNQKIIQDAENSRQRLEMVNRENQNFRIEVTDLENLKARVNYLSIQLEEHQAKVAELERQNTFLTETNQKVVEEMETSRQMLETAKRENQTLQTRIAERVTPIPKPMTQTTSPSTSPFIDYQWKISTGNCLTHATTSMRVIGFKLSNSTGNSEIVGSKGNYKGVIACISNTTEIVVFIVAGPNYRQAKNFAIQMKDNF